MNLTRPDQGVEATRRGGWRGAWLVAGALLTATALVAGCLGVVTVWAVVQGSSTKTVNQVQSYPRSAPRIEARIGFGTVTVTGQEAERMDVERDLTWSHERPTVAETWDDDTFRVDAECGNGGLPWVNLGCSVDYRATVQRDAAADLRTNTAPIEVRELDGPVDASTTTGNVTLDTVAGPLTTRTSTGDVVGTALRSPRADVETSTGDTTLSFAEAPDRVAADVSTGAVTIELPRGSGPYRVEVRSSDADRLVEVATDPNAERVIDVATSTGDVEIRYTSQIDPASAIPGETGTRDRLRQDVREIHDDLGVTGVLAEAQTAEGRIVERAGVADRRTGRTIADRAVFRNGSNTKTFLATVVLQLVDEGRLHLDDTVDDWLPGLVRGNGNDGSRITVRDLLQHTSGLYDYVADVLPGSAQAYHEHRFDRYTPRELIAIAMRHHPEFRPGATNPDGTPKWSYTNTGYVLLGMIIEEATGKTWRQQVERRIIQPLSLRSTTVPEHRTTLPHPRLHGYKQFRPGGPLTDVTALNPSVADASGSMVTTPTDINRFFRALAAGELLAPAQLDQMRQTVPTGWGGQFEGTRYGLGLFWYPLPCTDAGYWAHGGGILGYTTRNAVSDDGDESVTIAMSSELSG